MSPKQGTSPASRWIDHHRLTHFRAGYTKRQALPNGSQAVVEFPYVQINPKSHINFLVVDVDQPEALMLLMHPAVPPATWIIHKEESGHAQAGWAIDPVYRGRGHRAHPVRYAKSVLRSLNRLVVGDSNFTHHFVQNPAARFPVGTVYWGRRETPWPLGELHRHMASYIDPFHDEVIDGPAVSAWQPNPDRKTKRRRVARARAKVTGRNSALFYSTRKWLWTQWEEQEVEPHEPDALAYARALNRELERPLADKEVRELSASACRQVRDGKGRPAKYFRKGKVNRFLSKVGRIGGKKTTEAKSEAARQNVERGRTVRSAMADLRALKAQTLHAAGESLKGIAEALQASTRTVSRWLKRRVGIRDVAEAQGEADIQPVASTMSTPEEASCGGVQPLLVEVSEAPVPASEELQMDQQAALPLAFPAAPGELGVPEGITGAHAPSQRLETRSGGCGRGTPWHPTTTSPGPGPHTLRS